MTVRRFITKSFDDGNNYVYDKEAITYIYGIIDQLMKSQPGTSEKPSHGAYRQERIRKCLCS